MLLARWLVMMLLLAAAVSFVIFAATGQQKYKRFGLVVMKWTLLATLAFFIVMFIDRAMS